MVIKKLFHSRVYDIGRATISSKVDKNSAENGIEVTSNKCIFGKRHVVAMMGFAVLGLLSAQFVSLGVSIVAMVNHTRALENNWSNRTEVSCPMLLSAENTTNFKIPGEFEWDSTLQGYILGASTLGFLLTQLIGGRLGETWGAKRLILIGNIISGIFTVVSAPAARWNVYVLIAFQFARGLAQGLIMVSIFIMNANWFPRRERSLLSTIVNCGFSFGSAVGGMVAGWLCDIPQLGWPSTFYSAGIADLIISIIFAIIIYETPKVHPRITKEELQLITEDQEMDVSIKRPPIPWKRILTSIPVYALIVANFGYFWSLTYFMALHPTYMGTILHYSMTENGMISCLPQLIRTLGGFIASLVTNWLQKYLSVNTLRKGCNSFGAFGYSLCLVGVILSGCDALMNNVWFILALFFTGIHISGSLIVSVDISPRFPGTIMGIATTIPSIGAAFLPVIAGTLTDHETQEEWHYVFYLSIGLASASGIIFIIFGSAEVQPWNFNEDETEKRKIAEENAKNDSEIKTKL